MENPSTPALKNLLSFINSSISEMNEAEFSGLLFNYTRFVCHSSFKYDFLDSRDVNNRYTEKLLEDGSSDVFSIRKQEFMQIQAHLRSQLDKFINVHEETGEQLKEVFPVTKGSRKIVWNTQADKLMEVFIPDGLKIDGSIDMKQENKLADLALIDLLLDSDLLISRFRKCGKCGEYFYQFTKKEKIYCSTKCATAARQIVHQRKKKKK
jgi:hypothetical protein